MKFIIKADKELEFPDNFAELIPASYTGEVINYGQGEGQIKLGETVWGFYYGDDYCVVQYEEGTLEWPAIVSIVNAIKENLENLFECPIELVPEGPFNNQEQEIQGQIKRVESNKANRSVKNKQSVITKAEKVVVVGIDFIEYLLKNLWNTILGIGFVKSSLTFLWTSFVFLLTSIVKFYEKFTPLFWTLIVLFYPFKFLVIGIDPTKLRASLALLIMSLLVVAVLILYTMMTASFKGKIYYILLLGVWCLIFNKSGMWTYDSYPLHIKEILTEEEWKEIGAEYEKQYSLLKVSDTGTAEYRRKDIEYSQGQLIRDSLMANTSFPKVEYLNHLWGDDSVLSLCTGGGFVGTWGVHIALNDSFGVEDNSFKVHPHLKVFYAGPN